MNATTAAAHIVFDENNSHQFIETSFGKGMYFGIVYIAHIILSNSL